jgi:Mg/Co/Ni transporter MgtE
MVGRPVNLDNISNKLERLLRSKGILLEDINYKFKTKMTLQNLLQALILGLVLFLIYFVVSLFIQGTILMIVGAILAVVFLIKIVQMFGL